ncbi:hypothetical protein EL26_14500 [Tumebacillus flagellatus]|uniref:Uncharacterized protein n=1 Tax=Tumebacillus flagellatus TaxID=1157490 RepID=A0A074M9I8_9BACL|nr:hypothetical protein EL26_14500 [Tumebacillus flagellatus]
MQAFSDVLLGWADDRRQEGRERPLLQRSAGKWVFGDEQKRIVQDRVCFDLQTPPRESGRILWVYANPYIDLLAGPYGLEILDSICRESGFVTKLTNPFTEFLDPMRGLQELVDRFQPQMIGISFRNMDDALIIHSLDGDPESVDTLEMFPEVRRVAEALRGFRGPVFIGGAAFGMSPEQFLDALQLEYGIYGAADPAISQLCEAWTSDVLGADPGDHGKFRELWSQLPSALWREGGAVRRNDAARTRVLTQTPRIKRTWAFSYKNVRDYLPEPVRGAQGCPLACSYCVESVNRMRMSFRSVEQVVDEIEFSLRRYGIRVFHIADSEANVPMDRLTGLAKEIVRRNLHHEILWTAYLNARPFEAAAIPLLVESGLYRFKFAFDHFDDRVLQSYHKNFREKDLEAILDAFEPYIGHIQLYAGILLGGPGEDESTLAYAMQRMKEHAKRGFTFYYNVGVRIYPGTPFGKQFLENPDASGYYGPGKSDGGLSALIYSAPEAPRVLAARLEERFQDTPRVFRMNKEKTTGIGYEAYRQYLVAWNAWLDGRWQEAYATLDGIEQLEQLREGVALQRLLRMKLRQTVPTNLLGGGSR